MTSGNESKPVRLAAKEEQDKISRSILHRLNQYPGLPPDIEAIRYEILEEAADCMALSTVQGAHILQQYIVSGYKAEYQFRLIYRIKPGGGADKRLEADELLDSLGEWVSRQRPDIGEALHLLSIEPATRSSLSAVYENGDEEHQILMKIIYEVM